MHEEEISEQERKADSVLNQVDFENGEIDKKINSLPNDKPLFEFKPEGFSNNSIPKKVKIANYRKQQELKKENAIKKVTKIMKESVPIERDKIFAKLNKWMSPEKNLDLSNEQDKAMKILRDFKDEV